MKYPKLVKDCDCKTEVKLFIGENEIGEYGDIKQANQIIAKCNYQGGGKIIVNDNKETIEISGTCLFSYDIIPDLYEITNGKIEIFGDKRDIYKGTKARNPDGTVNFVRLEIL